MQISGNSKPNITVHAVITTSNISFNASPRHGTCAGTKRRTGATTESLAAVELRGAGSPCGAAGPAALRFGLVLKARNFPSRASARPFTASAAAAARSPLTGSSRLSRSMLGSRREVWVKARDSTAEAKTRGLSRRTKAKGDVLKGANQEGKQLGEAILLAG